MPVGEMGAESVAVMEESRAEGAARGSTSAGISGVGTSAMEASLSRWGRECSGSGAVTRATVVGM